MSGTVAAIVGPGNIGTDRLAKLRRIDAIEVAYMVGVVESDGLARARVYSSFLLHAEHAAQRYGVDGRARRRDQQGPGGEGVQHVRRNRMGKEVSS